MRNRLTYLRIAAIGALVVLLAPAAFGQDECNPVCDSFGENCATAGFLVKIGGQYSKGSNLSKDPATLGDDPNAGTVATADLEFAYSAAPGAATGTLTVTVTNTTAADCGGSSTLSSWFFNVDKTKVANLNLFTETACAGSLKDWTSWAVLPTGGDPADGDNQAGTKANGFGYFDYRVLACDSAGCNEGLRSELDGASTRNDCARFTFTVTPTAAFSDASTLTACDFGVDDYSMPATNERRSKFAVKFQAADPDGNVRGDESGFIDSCSDNGDLLVELASFDTTPADNRVTVDWSTALERDNQGFYIWRADITAGVVERLSGFIPAIAVNNQGASYSFEDDSAISGVEYTYWLEDIDILGLSTNHLAVGEIPNPTDPVIRLISPAYGATVSGDGLLTVQFEAPGRGFYVLMSSDPTFLDRSSRLLVRSNLDGEVRLNRRQMGRLNGFASQSDGVVYWRVVEVSSNDIFRFSQTWRMEIEPAADTAPGRRIGWAVGNSVTDPEIGQVQSRVRR